MHGSTGASSERVLSGPTSAGRLSAGTGGLLPDLTLATPSGAPVALGQYSGRRNLVVVLLDAGSPGEIVARLLAPLVHARATLDEEEAEVLVVRPDGAGALADDEAGS
ncbi:MAG TPA: hypothetical protein VFW98_13275, partial [Gemmatimonadaceae bacterium]|nr:hypothetical protein [Gemmatimonadaceae bacterium]